MTDTDRLLPLKTTAAPEPMSYAIEDVPTVTGIPRTKIFGAVRDKQLTARKSGRSTIVEAAELKRWIRSLPTRGRAPDEQPTAA